ncbi:putative protocadherin beta-18 [Spea bombifrons]|uniref:putative protocadherin beta-18 n=1 Tax=Spea bombifrons TaxID=233779 RepID=UPI00234BA65A|nr:putative protocadherin beta-18 [Spea bombifrons]
MPFFTSSIYEATVTEGLELGTFVLQVSASDQDLGLNGEITYSILEDRSGDHALFHIDPQTGVIYTAAVFDRETKGSYLLEVMSSDGSESARPGKHGQPNSGEDNMGFILAQWPYCSTEMQHTSQELLLNSFPQPSPSQGPAEIPIALPTPRSDPAKLPTNHPNVCSQSSVHSP